MGYDMQPQVYINGEPYVPSDRYKGKDFLKFHKFLRNAGFNLTIRNPSIVQLKLGQHLFLGIRTF